LCPLAGFFVSTESSGYTTRVISLLPVLFSFICGMPCLPDHTEAYEANTLLSLLFSFLRSVVPQHVLGVVYVLMFLLAVVIHGRQMEWTARLDFLWQIQVRVDLLKYGCWALFISSKYCWALITRKQICH
jgi:adenylate cyclase 1